MLGLAENGTENDWPAIAPFLAADSLRIKKAALRACNILRPKGWKDTVENALKSKLLGMFRQALRIVADSRDDFDLSTLEDIYLMRGADLDRIRVLSMLDCCNRWETLAFLSRLLIRTGTLDKPMNLAWMRWVGRYQTRQIYTSMGKENRQLFESALEILKNLRCDTALLRDLQLVWEREAAGR